MTASQIELVTGDTQTSGRLLARLGEAALAALAFALLSGVWLAFFTFLPFDFTPRIG
jgi:hypothetical protein